MAEKSTRVPGRHARHSDGRGRWWLALVLAGAVLGGTVLTVGSLRSDPDAAAAPPAETALPTASQPESVPVASATVSPSASPSRAAPSRSPSPVPPKGPARSSAKKGVSVWDFDGLGAALTDVHASWYYNWSSRPSSGAGTSARFVPMIWGAKSVNDAELARAKAAGDVLLGFNEPDFDSQADMSVEQALKLWPRLQATGMRLGSPAVAVDAARPGGWLDKFISGTRARGYRVDFIALHWYGSDFGDAAVGHLRGYLQAVHDRYGLPIWLTEYSLIKFSGGGATYPTDAQQAAFVTNSTAMLQRLAYVERYAWFALPTPEGRQGTGLYRDGDTPTAAGRAYRAAG